MALRLRRWRSRNVPANSRPHAFCWSVPAAALHRIFVQLADGGGPTVRYIDLFGSDLRSGQPLRERVEP